MELKNIASQPPTPRQPAPSAGVESGTSGAVQNEAPAPTPASIPNQKSSNLQISGAAKKLLQEATETAAQTAAEASKGDPQAKRLLAKEEAAKERNEPNPATEAKGGNFDLNA